VHRLWYLTKAMDVLFGTDRAVAEKNRLDRMREYKQELFLWPR